ncbi:MAG: DEAD/DEAH box helicase, partial [Phycisphaerales bacterium]|nr:DEAD/DEAH box helicase [Phycisphaerales bacterium]
MSFTDLGLAEPIVRAVSAKGYETATDIQASAIPPALTGRDVLGTAQTGTGKTCAFALPILHRLAEADAGVEGKAMRFERKRTQGRTVSPRALVLCPTRELATQIHESFVSYGHQLKLGYGVIYGGVKQYHQVKALRRGADVLVATPGRLKDLHEQGIVKLDQVEVLVLDEADRMLDMGFLPDIRRIVGLIPEQRQTMLFSATISKEIRTLAADLMSEPEVVETAPESTTLDTITQRVFMVEPHRKVQLLTHVLAEDKVQRAVVFTRTKYGADKVARRLARSGVTADAIHSNKTQAARNATMRDFKRGDVRVLVATDIASRGIDVDDVTHVVNYDMPIDPETWVHRIGRTARAGATGTAVTFCMPEQAKLLRSIERRAQITLPTAEDLPTMAPAPRADTGGESRNEKATNRRTTNGGFTPKGVRGFTPKRDGGFKKSFKKDFKKGGFKPKRVGGYKPKWQSRDGDAGYTPKWKRDGEGKGGEGRRPLKPKREQGFNGSFKKEGFKKQGFKPKHEGGFKPKWKRDGEGQDGEGRGSFTPKREGGFKKSFKKDFKKDGFKGS